MRDTNKKIWSWVAGSAFATLFIIMVIPRFVKKVVNKIHKKGKEDLELEDWEAEVVEEDITKEE